MHMYCTHVLYMSMHMYVHWTYTVHVHVSFLILPKVHSKQLSGLSNNAKNLIAHIQTYSCTSVCTGPVPVRRCAHSALPNCTATARDLHVHIHQFITHTTSNENTPRSRHNAGYTFMYSCTCIYTQDTDVPVHVHACMCTCTVHVHVYGTSSLKSGERLFIHSGSFSM